MGDNINEDCASETQSSSVDGVAGHQRSFSGDSLVEWRSSEQVESGNPSTSASYWDTDDEDSGPRPSDLYGKFTWKIEGFSQISKRELRSNIFEVGGYNWYILIYPQGCDVCNHLSLFLCVANHDKLLPGWSHFAQFTITVVNTDSKKSKYSDTLHRFWKKEHDWGWKKFMELTKISDGFLVDDTLVIKAQVQVIREKPHQPFRCLDCQYGRELVGVYLSSVEKLCRRYLEDKRSKFIKLIDDKVRWPSLHAFWVAIDPNTRRRMSCDKAEVVLKVVVKHFFIENEVTSTLVMDYLYTGLKIIECQSKIHKDGLDKLIEIDDMPEPLVFVENDVFVLTDDILMILERAALEPLPPKNDKASPLQCRFKEDSTIEDLESIELDQRRLTELGRRTVEMFAVNHIFSMIEIAYQEAVAFRRQEELIREEEAAENELRSRRHAMEKEKRTKKKQVKQKKNNRKNKEKGRSEKCESSIKSRLKEIDIISSDALEEASEDLLSNHIPESNLAAVDIDGAEMNEPEVEERESSPTSCVTDPLEIYPVTNIEENHTDRWMCSTDPVFSTKGISSSSKNILNSHSRGKNQQYILHQKSQSLGDINRHHKHNAFDFSGKSVNRLPLKVDVESTPALSRQEKQSQISSIKSSSDLSSSIASSALTIKTSSRSTPSIASAGSRSSVNAKSTISNQRLPSMPSLFGPASLDPSLAIFGRTRSYRNVITGSEPMRENPPDASRSIASSALTLKTSSPRSITPARPKSTPSDVSDGRSSVIDSEPMKESPSNASSCIASSAVTPKISSPWSITPVRPKSTPSTESEGRWAVITDAEPMKDISSDTSSSIASSALTLKTSSSWPVTPVSPKSTPLVALEGRPSIPIVSDHRPPWTSPHSWVGTLDPSPTVTGHVPSYRNAIDGRTAPGAAPPLPSSALGSELTSGSSQYEFPHLDIINDLLDDEQDAKDEEQSKDSPSYSFPGSLDDSYLYEQLVFREDRYLERSMLSQRVRPWLFDRSSIYVDGSIDSRSQKRWAPGSAWTYQSDGEYFYDQSYLDMLRVMNDFHPLNGP